MTPETLGQILAAARAQMCAVGKQITAELMLPEARITCETLRHHVLPAVSEQQYALFTGQVSGSLTIEMNNGMAAEPDSVVL